MKVKVKPVPKTSKPVKGGLLLRRRLPFSPGPSNLPLNGKKIYLDLKNFRSAKAIEDDLLRLGASVEKFLSKEIDYLISSQARASGLKGKDGSGGSQGVSTPSPGISTPSPFNMGADGSPMLLTEKQKKEQTSRGKALFKMARLDVAKSVLDNAENWGVKIIHIDRALTWINKEKSKVLAAKGQSTTSQAPGKKKQNKKDKVLKSPMLKFESDTKGYKPLYLEFSSWPRVNVETPLGSCPFDGVAMKSGGKRAALQAERLGALDPLPDLLSSENEDRGREGMKVEASAGGKEKSGKTDSLGFGQVLTAGQLRRITEKKKRAEKKRGYCECCKVKYEDLYKHIRGDDHKQYVREEKAHYDDLDKLIDTGPKIEEFLQIALKETNTTGQSYFSQGSGDGDDYVQLLSPIRKKSKTATPSKRVSLRQNNIRLCPEKSAEPASTPGKRSARLNKSMSMANNPKEPQENLKLTKTLESIHGNREHSEMLAKDRKEYLEKPNVSDLTSAAKLIGENKSDFVRKDLKNKELVEEENNGKDYKNKRSIEEENEKEQELVPQGESRVLRSAHVIVDHGVNNPEKNNVENGKTTKSEKVDNNCGNSRTPVKIVQNSPNKRTPRKLGSPHRNGNLHQLENVQSSRLQELTDSQKVVFNNDNDVTQNKTPVKLLRNSCRKRTPIKQSSPQFKDTKILKSPSQDLTTSKLEKGNLSGMKKLNYSPAKTSVLNDSVPSNVVLKSCFVNCELLNLSPSKCLRTRKGSIQTEISKKTTANEIVKTVRPTRQSMQSLHNDCVDKTLRNGNDGLKEMLKMETGQLGSCSQSENNCVDMKTCPAPVESVVYSCSSKASLGKRVRQSTKTGNHKAGNNLNSNSSELSTKSSNAKRRKKATVGRAQHKQTYKHKISAFKSKWRTFRSVRHFKLPQKWRMLTNTSVGKILNSENDAETFDGFTEADLSMKEKHSEMSYEDVSEIHVEEGSDIEWEITLSGQDRTLSQPLVGELHTNDDIQENEASVFQTSFYKTQKYSEDFENELIETITEKLLSSHNSRTCLSSEKVTKNSVVALTEKANSVTNEKLFLKDVRNKSYVTVEKKTMLRSPRKSMRVSSCANPVSPLKTAKAGTIKIIGEEKPVTEELLGDQQTSSRVSNLKDIVEDDFKAALICSTPSKNNGKFVNRVNNVRKTPNRRCKNDDVDVPANFTCSTPSKHYDKPLTSTAVPITPRRSSRCLAMGSPRSPLHTAASPLNNFVDKLRQEDSDTSFIFSDPIRSPLVSPVQTPSRRAQAQNSPDKEIVFNFSSPHRLNAMQSPFKSAEKFNMDVDTSPFCPDKTVPMKSANRSKTVKRLYVSVEIPKAGKILEQETLSSCQKDKNKLRLAKKIKQLKDDLCYTKDSQKMVCCSSTTFQTKETQDCNARSLHSVPRKQTLNCDQDGGSSVKTDRCLSNLETPSKNFSHDFTTPLKNSGLEFDRKIYSASETACSVDHMTLNEAPRRSPRSKKSLSLSDKKKLKNSCKISSLVAKPKSRPIEINNLRRPNWEHVNSNFTEGNSGEATVTPNKLLKKHADSDLPNTKHQHVYRFDYITTAKGQNSCKPGLKSAQKHARHKRQRSRSNESDAKLPKSKDSVKNKACRLKHSDCVNSSESELTDFDNASVKKWREKLHSASKTEEYQRRPKSEILHYSKTYLKKQSLGTQDQEAINSPLKNLQKEESLYEFDSS